MTLSIFSQTQKESGLNSSTNTPSRTEFFETIQSNINSLVNSLVIELSSDKMSDKALTLYLTARIEASLNNQSSDKPISLSDAVDNARNDFLKYSVPLKLGDSALETHNQKLSEGLEYIRNKIIPSLETRQPNIGCESEGIFINMDSGLLSHNARKIISSVKNPSIQGEFGDSQFEINFPVFPLTGNCFSESEKFETESLSQLAYEGAKSNSLPLRISIAPLLKESELSSSFLADSLRINLCSDAWGRAYFDFVRRNEALPELATYQPSSLAVSTAMSSTQFHYELPADPIQAGYVYNIVLLITPIVLAASTGSPFLLNGVGDQKELRVDLWQKLDDLGRGRVYYGDKWVSSPLDALEYACDIPSLRLWDEKKEMSSFEYLQAHVGSTWPFLRVIVAEDHWRVENRVFSSLPPVDAVATSAFYYGLIRGLEINPHYKDFTEKMDFERCRDNFYNAAQDGLDSSVDWPGVGKISSQALILKYLLEIARTGLEDLKVDPQDIDRYLGIMRERVEKKATVADWMKNYVENRQELPKDEVLKELTLDYALNQLSGEPSGQWGE